MLDCAYLGSRNAGSPSDAVRRPCRRRFQYGGPSCRKRTRWMASQQPASSSCRYMHTKRLVSRSRPSLLRLGSGGSPAWMAERASRVFLRNPRPFLCITEIGLHLLRVAERRIAVRSYKRAVSTMVWRRIQRDMLSCFPPR